MIAALMREATEEATLPASQAGGFGGGRHGSRRDVGEGALMCGSIGSRLVLPIAKETRCTTQTHLTPAYSSTVEKLAVRSRKAVLPQSGVNDTPRIAYQGFVAKVTVKISVVAIQETRPGNLR